MRDTFFLSSFYFVFFFAFFRLKCGYRKEYRKKWSKKKQEENEATIHRKCESTSQFQWVLALLSMNLADRAFMILPENTQTHQNYTFTHWNWVQLLSMNLHFIGSILSSNGKKFGISTIKNVAVFHFDWMLIVRSFVLNVTKCIAWRFVQQFVPNSVIRVFIWFGFGPIQHDCCRWSIFKMIILIFNVYKF